MDVAALSMALSQANIMNEINLSLLGNSLDAVREAGDNLVEMMEVSVSPDLGQNIDISL